MFPYNILLNIKSGITPVKSRDSATLFLFNCRRWVFVNNQILDKEGKRTMIIEEIYAGVAISTIYLKVQREDNAAWIQTK